MTSVIQMKQLTHNCQLKSERMMTL